MENVYKLRNDKNIDFDLALISQLTNIETNRVQLPFLLHKPIVSKLSC